MDKRQLHHIWTKLRIIKPWYFLIIFLVAGTVCVFALRHNYSTMVDLRNKVYQVDKKNGDVYTALQNLRQYVYAHMNTNLTSAQNSVYPPIQLKYTYDRLVKAESAKVSKENATIYTDAQNYCQAKIPNGFSGRYRVPCINKYVSSHNIKQASIPKSLYEFDFVSPSWAPDLAGWSLVVAVLSLLAFIVSFIANKIIKRYIS